MVAETIKERDDLLRYQIFEMAEWARIARKSREYYHGHQQDETLQQESRRIRHTVNGIRRDIDQQKGRVADADPEMSAQGRGAEDFQLGQAWRDLLGWADDWTGIRYDSVDEVRDKVLDDFFQTGEGIEKNTWSVDEESGMGMVVCERVDNFHLAWDGNATSIQRRNADWMCQFEPVDIKKLEQEFPRLKNKIREDVPDFFMEGLEETQLEEYKVLRDSQNTPGALKRAPQAYRREWWEKRPVKRRSFLLNGKPAKIQVGDEVIEVDDEAYDAMPEAEQDLYDVTEYTDYELWCGVMINDTWAIKPELSQYDEQNKGHGEYPYAFYSNVWDSTWSHYHGEVEYLMGHQDAINEAVSAWLDALFVANSQWLEVEVGAYPRGEQGKLQNSATRPMQTVFKHPGTKSAQWIAPNPTSGQIYQSGIQMLQQFKDDQSGVQGVNRGAPEYQLSGKAVRALQSEMDLLSVNQRIHLESGLRQATMIRIALLQQFFRGSRMVRIVPAAGETDREPYNLYMGESEDRVKARFGLRPKGEKGKYEDRDGAAGEVLEINDASVRKFDLKLQLSSGRDKNQADREEAVKLMLSYLGPGAGPGVVKWAAGILDVPNREMLNTELDKADQQAQVVAQLQQIQEQTGLGIQELAQLAQQAAMMQQGQAGQQAPPGAAAPSPGPPGPPQGPPQGQMPPQGPPGPMGAPQ